MILDAHPDESLPKILKGATPAMAEKLKKLFASRDVRRAIGYWRSELEKEKDLPDPSEYVDETWSAKERDVVVKYLQKGRRLKSWLGYSGCRFCGARNGTTCLGDDAFVWPEGFAHYLTEHKVKPAQEFIDHVLAVTEERKATRKANAEKKKAENVEWDGSDVATDSSDADAVAIESEPEPD
jgi:hypothetical protein